MKKNGRGCCAGDGTRRALVQSRSIPAGQRDPATSCKSLSYPSVQELDDNNPTKMIARDQSDLESCQYGRCSNHIYPKMSTRRCVVSLISGCRLGSLTRAKNRLADGFLLFSGIQRRLQYSGCCQRNNDSEESTASGRYHRSWR